MNKNDRKEAIESLKAEANEKYGEDGWTSVYKSFTLPGGDSETVRVVNPRRVSVDTSDDDDQG